MIRDAVVVVIGALVVVAVGCLVVGVAVGCLVVVVVFVTSGSPWQNIYPNRMKLGRVIAIGLGVLALKSVCQKSYSSLRYPRSPANPSANPPQVPRYSPLTHFHIPRYLPWSPLTHFLTHFHIPRYLPWSPLTHFLTHFRYQGT